jgi:hypothetical protein
VRDDVRPLAVRPWLYRVAHNAALNAVEKKGSDWEELDENYDGVPQPPQVAEQRARFLKIVGEIESLPERQREALVLNEFEGRCYADIAAQLGTSESGVRGLLRRARRQLRETAAALLLPSPVLREFVRSDGGRGAGELLGTAGAAGGVGAAGGFAKVAAGVLAVGTIAGGGTAIQQSDEPLRASDAKAADVAKHEPAPAEDSVKTVLSQTADDFEMAPSTVIRVTENRARLGAGSGATTSPTGFDGWVGGIQTDSGTAQPVEEGGEEPLLPTIDDAPLTVDGAEEEQPSGEAQEEAPPAAEVQDGEKQPDSSEQPSAQEQPGQGDHAQESEPGSLETGPPVP